MTVQELTDAAFAAHVTTAKGVAVVDVWAEWCTPCRALVPIMERLSAEFAGRASVYKLDADANAETAVRFDVRALPTVLIFRDGALMQRLVGAQSYATYATAISAAADAPAPNVSRAATNASLTTPTAPAPENAAVARATELLAADVPTLVFKHSNSCPVSFAAKHEYDRFVAANPHIPTHLVVVQQERPVSHAIAHLTRVEHESPQALIVRRGASVWNASHRAITADRLEAAFAQLSNDQSAA